MEKRVEKTVLLSYLERNAVVKVPQLLQNEADITFWKEKLEGDSLLDLKLT